LYEIKNNVRALKYITCSCTGGLLQYLKLLPKIWYPKNLQNIESGALKLLFSVLLYFTLPEMPLQNTRRRESVVHHLACSSFFPFDRQTPTPVVKQTNER
jgi:hypothetical protein